jgi:DNA-binding transcriptional MerR regulator
MTTIAPLPSTLSIGEVCERTGLSPDTLRFYEREGLFVHPIDRTAGDRRRYTDSDVEWLHMCVRFRSTGMSLPDIRRYAELVRQGAGNEADRYALLTAHQAKIRAQMDEIMTCQTIIESKVDHYRARLDEGTASALWTGEPSTC